MSDSAIASKPAHTEQLHGCFNHKPFLSSLLVQDGYHESGDTRLPRYVRIPFRMSTECNYRHTAEGLADKYCHGCAHRDAPKGHAADTTATHG